MMPIYPELAGGIGSAAARAFASPDANVFLLDINGKALNEVSDTLLGRRHRTCVSVDLTDEVSVQNAFGQILETGLGLDILINCAGEYRYLRTVEEMDLDEWSRTMVLNLTGVFLCCRAAIPALKNSKQGKVAQSLKDFRLILAHAEAHQQALPLASTYTRLFEDCVARGEGEEDNASIVRAIARQRPCEAAGAHA